MISNTKEIDYPIVLNSSTSITSNKYRPDIDGLRAVAVLLVIGYHLDISLFSGGFIGVDIFFVISGYLIGAILITEIDAGKFSFKKFYERRIRRIFPALTVMFVLSGLGAFLVLLPTELIDYSKSLIAALFSFSNIFFWLESGYFDAQAITKPLLHTWSLGVEEQFYLVFPLILLVITRLFPGNIRRILMALALLSLAISCIQLRSSQPSVFYLLHARAWELFVGTLVYLDIIPQIKSTRLRNLAALAGILLILVPAIVYSGATPFPGLMAVPPCVGAALVINSGRSASSWVSRVLSARPLVFTGLISYSLYLYHWPIIVLQRLIGFNGTSSSSWSFRVFGMLVPSFAVAFLSWRFVERPFRDQMFQPKAFMAIAGLTVVSLMLALIALATSGFGSRFPQDAVKASSYLSYNSEKSFRVGSCFITSQQTFDNFDKLNCLRIDPAKANYLILGDSHAAQLWPGLSKVFPDINFLDATASGCRPTITQPVGAVRRCATLMRFIYSEYLPKNKINTLLLAGHWDSSDLSRLSETIKWAKERNLPVVVFGPIIQYDQALPRLLAREIREGNTAIPKLHRITSEAAMDAQMNVLAAEKWRIPYISFFKLLCSSEACTTYASAGVPLQFDYGHMTEEGSELFAQRVKAASLLPGLNTK